MRICTKCGNVEDASVFFCTKCGWKTELKEVEDTVLSPGENGNEPVTGKKIVSPIKSTDTEELSEENFIDICCPYCKEKLSFMSWQFDEFFLKCPMCNRTIFIDHPDLDDYSESEYTYSENEQVDEADENEEILDIEQEQDFIDVQCPSCNKVFSYMSWQLEEDSVVCPDCNEEIYTVFLEQTDGVMKVLSKSEEDLEEESEEELEEIESDEVTELEQECFVDVTCPSCNAELSFMNWQVEDELTCPICGKIFRVW